MTRTACSRWVGHVQPNSQAATLGVKPGDIIVSYNGEHVSNQQDLQTAMMKAASAELDSIPVVVKRDGKDIDLKFKPGPLGIIPIIEYDDPTFQ